MPKKYTKRGVELTRCSQTMTEAAFFSMLLSGLRRLTLYWRPRQDKLNEKRRAYTGTDKRTKWEYQCEICKEWYTRKQIELDHIVPCGGINSFDKISTWCERAFVEKNGFRRLCKECHLTVTHKR